MARSNSLAEKNYSLVQFKCLMAILADNCASSDRSQDARPQPERRAGLLEGLVVAILIVVALLTIGLGWRKALIVAAALPVVFGLTLAANLVLGYTINRVTLFALILSLGLLVDDPIVDVENIARHFALRKIATR